MLTCKPSYTLKDRHHPTEVITTVRISIKTPSTLAAQAGEAQSGIPGCFT
ncbi:hypothetical protein [Bacillus sp. FJAT-27264]|nr:hypothetical protein [Bacillus sp. FJAT-27264]